MGDGDSGGIDRKFLRVYFARLSVRSVVRTQFLIDRSVEASIASGHASGRVLRVYLRLPGEPFSDLFV